MRIRLSISRKGKGYGTFEVGSKLPSNYSEFVSGSDLDADMIFMILYTHVQVCRESCCHAQMSLYLYKHECRRKPLICFEQVSLNGIIINS